MSIYKDLLDAVYDGKKFKVDLVNKSLWINKRQIIKKGVIIDEQNKSEDLICSDDLSEYWSQSLNGNTWKWIEFLYDTYKHSVPRENSNKTSYFKALSVNELNDGELAYNAERDYMQAILEGYILLGVLQGWITWEYGNHWFWQGKDKDLVVLKDWIL